LLQSLKIILLAVAAAIVYGILHDLFTVHLCLEYFTKFHPPILGGTQNPILLALGWGVIATWWVGLPLGILLAIASRAVRAHQLTWRDQLQPIIILLVFMAIAALVMGQVARVLTDPANYETSLARYYVPREKMLDFNSCLAMHQASYIAGALGGLLLVLVTIFRRIGRVPHTTKRSQPPAAGFPPQT